MKRYNTMEIISPAVKLLAAGTLLLAGAAARADITVSSNRVVATPRHIIAVDDTGLPGQLEINAVISDIPLVWRAQEEARVRNAKRDKNAKVGAPEWPAPLLRSIGRGPQLTSPMRIEAVIDGATIVAKADAPAELKKTDNGVEAVGNWQADDLKGGVRILYGADGAMTGQVTFDPGGAKLERLDLVLELSGPVDTAVAGNPADAVAGKPLSWKYGSLASEPGMLWSDGNVPAGDGGMHKGRVAHFFLGTGDRGFTWLADSDDGFVIGGDDPSMSVERTREEVTVWRIALVNKRVRGGERTAGFTLLTHPVRDRAADRRAQQWRLWAGDVAVPKLAAAARGTIASNSLVRADVASVHEAGVSRAVLAGPAGGDALSVEATVADRFPIGLFRYLAAPHTALDVQLCPNSVALVTPGDSPAPDRVALGRALLHDVGVDLRGIAGAVESAAVVRVLEDFGYFSADGATEFLPYWRSEGMVRYGEAFEDEAKDGFAVTKENPAGRTRVSVFIRPDGRFRKALFVVVNEGDRPVRQLFYVRQPRYFFGVRNQIKLEAIYSQLDFSRIPPDGDWSRHWVLNTTQPETRTASLVGRGVVHAKQPEELMNQLMDVESGGYVRLVATGSEKSLTTKKGEEFEMYGPVFVPARGMRILYGSGEKNSLPSGVRGGS